LSSRKNRESRQTKTERDDKNRKIREQHFTQFQPVYVFINRS
jgi:hypothetical protein